MFGLMQGVHQGTTAAWTPASLSVSPKTWIDPSNASSITSSGGAISQINDLSGNGAHFTQATGTKQPTDTASAINGLHAMSFANVNSQSLLATISVNGTQAAVFHVVKLNGASSGNYGRCCSFANPAGFDYDNANSFCLTQNGTAGSIALQRNNVAIAGSVTDNTPMIASGVLDGSTGVLYANGTSLASAASTGTLIFPKVAIAGQTFGADYSTQICGEFLVLGYAPTTTERQKIEGYLAWKWGLQASLPSGHPYLSAAP